MNHTTASPPRVTARLNSRSDGIEAYAWQVFLAAATPYAEKRSTASARTLAPRPRIPTEAVIRLALQTANAAIVVAESDGYAVAILSGPQETEFHVAARTVADADGLLNYVCGEREGNQDRVTVNIWSYNHQSARSWRRSLSTPTWAEIRRNYPEQVAAQLDDVMRLRTIVGTGRLLICTGEPGTGKTSAIRALLDAWKDWAHGHLVVDPECFFGEAAYLMEVMASRTLRRSQPDLDVDFPPSERWNLVVCEDADDFIRAEARGRSGAGVGRLLNLADGLLGQGLNTIVLLTSNTPIAELDPALLRPGRCLARIEFDRFDRSSAREWLDDTSARVRDEGITLAELYERKGTVERFGQPQPAAASGGLYL